MNLTPIVCAGLCLIAATSALCAPAMSPGDKKLVELIVAFDQRSGGGENYKNPDCGVLGWSESSSLSMFYHMYRVTGDTHWLDRLSTHADTIFNNATTDSRGHYGWFTRHYSLSFANAASDGANKGTAKLLPAEQTLSDKFKVETVSGGVFSLTVQPDGTLFVRDETAGAPGATIARGEKSIALSEFAFELSGDPQPGDRFTVKITAPEASDYIVHEGMFLRPICQFIETVLADKTLKAKYGTQAQRYLKAIDEKIIPKWNDRWRDFGHGQGAYLAPALRTHRFADITLPHNQYLALGQAFFPLYRVTGKKFYLERATAMAKFFKSKLIESQGGYIWYYWDAGLPQDKAGEPMHHIEDISHGALDVRFAVEAYEMGVVFTRQDIDRIAANYAHRLWNQSTDDPKHCYVVDRTRDPKGEHDKPFAHGWQMLARYSDDARKAAEPVYRLWEKSFSPPGASEWLFARYVKAVKP